MRGRRSTLALGGLAVVALAGATVLALWGVSLADDLDREQTLEANQEHAVAVLAQRDARRIELEGHPGMLVVARTGEAALIVSDLPPAPAGHEYQAWVAVGDTLREDVVFAGGGASTIVAIRSPVPEGATVSVTLEPDGSRGRTGSPVFTARTG